MGTVEGEFPGDHGPLRDRAVRAATIAADAMTSQRIAREASAKLIRRRQFRRDRLRLNASVPVPLWVLLLILATGGVQLAVGFALLLAR